MIKIAPTPDEAYEICKKYAPNCSIGQNKYWASDTKTYENRGGSTSFGSNSSSSSFESSSSFGIGGSDAFGRQGSSRIRTETSSEINSRNLGNVDFGTFSGQRTSLSPEKISGFGIRGDAYETGRYIPNKYCV